MANAEGMVKLRLYGTDAGDVETVWATPDGVNTYRLENSPFFAYGISWQDVVEAMPAADQVLEYVRCIRKSGNRTLRVIFEHGIHDPRSRVVLQALQRMGASYEGMQPKMISINVPDAADLREITRYLTRQADLQWEHADPTYDQITGRGEQSRL